MRALLDGRENGWAERNMIITAWQSAGPARDVSESGLSGSGGAAG